MAAAAIRLNLVRAIITIFIIAFGIMSLISMLTAVDGIKGALYANFAEVGSNTFSIKSEDPLQNMRRGFRKKENPAITYDESRAFQLRFHFPSKISINYEAAVDAVASRNSIQTAAQIKVIGSDEYYLSTSGLELQEGRNFTTKEVNSGRKVAIIGYKLREELFGQQDALGKIFQLNGQSYMLLGYLKEKGNTFGESPDNIVIIPLPAAQASFPKNEDISYNISVQIDQIEQLDNAIDDATGMFRAVRKLNISEENNFSITKSDSLAEALTQNISYLQWIAIAIGLVTLLGAAVGLTNIMLVSVTERTREIGVRKALGATSHNIRRQFLLEAVLITFIGGIIGVLLGVVLGNFVAQYLGGKFIFPLAWTALGLSLCILVGIFAGWYPAAKASRLDPVESLRYE